MFGKIRFCIKLGIDKGIDRLMTSGLKMKVTTFFVFLDK